MPNQLDSSFTQLPEGEMADSLTNKLANGAITEYTDVAYIDWNTYIKHKVIYAKKILKQIWFLECQTGLNARY